MSRPSAAAQAVQQGVDQAPADPAEQRHLKLLRMLGHLKDSLAFPLSRRELVEAMALAGYNANLDKRVWGASAITKAEWARRDAEALLASGSDEESVA